MLLGVRYYDTRIGRFVNLDSFKDGLNWYTYGTNNPLIHIDPEGFRFGVILPILNPCAKWKKILEQDPNLAAEICRIARAVEAYLTEEYDPLPGLFEDIASAWDSKRRICVRQALDIACWLEKANLKRCKARETGWVILGWQIHTFMVVDCPQIGTINLDTWLTGSWRRPCPIPNCPPYKKGDCFKDNTCCPSVNIR